MNDEDLSQAPLSFQQILQVDVPRGRDGKHKSIITRLLNELAAIGKGSALKIPIAQLPDSKENIRAALSRAARQNSLNIATSSNEKYLYVWKTNEQE